MENLYQQVILWIGWTNEKRNMIKKGSHKLHIALFVSISLVIEIVMQLVPFNNRTQPLWVSFRFIYPYLIPVAIVLLIGLIFKWARRPKWSKIYIIGWIFFAVGCGIALTLNVLSYSRGDSGKDGLSSWIEFGNSKPKGNYEDAIVLLNEKIAKNPKDDAAYLSRGYARYNIQDYKGAIVDYSKAIKLVPNTANAFSARGAARLKLQDYKGAIVDYDMAIELTGFTGIYLYKERADIKYLILDYKGAIADYHRIIELEGMKLTDKNLVFSAFLNKASIEFELGNYEAAIFDYTFAIDINPGTNSNAFYRRGLANLKLGLTDEACSDFRKAGELGNSEVYDLILEYCQ